MCKRVFVLNKGQQIYDGDFQELINNINPSRKLIYELPDNYDKGLIHDLSQKFSFIINENIITAELSEDILQNLLSQLLNKIPPTSLLFEDLPVEETMRSFFENPDKYLK